MKNKSLVIRTEANKKVALGHFRRCLSIALAFKKNGGDVCFICDDDPTVRSILQKEKIDLFVAPMAVGGQDEYEFVFSKLKELNSDLLLLDSYNLTREFVSQIREKSIKVAILNDLLEDYIESELTINSSLGAYQVEYPESSFEKLLGEKYVPLAVDYWDQEVRVKNTTKDILVTLGGIDHYGISEKVIEFVESWDTPLNLHVIIGPYYENKNSILNLANRAMQNIVLYDSPDGIADILKQVDLGVSAGGQSLYEFAALGVPCLGIALWPNQKPNVSGLMQKDAIVGLEYSEQGDFDSTLKSSLHNLLSNDSLRFNLSRVSRQLIDGLGALRIASALSKL